MGTFIDRNPDGSVKGMYFCRQYEGQEEVDNGHPDLLAFQHRPDPSVVAKQNLEAEIEGLKTVAEIKDFLKKVIR